MEKKNLIRYKLVHKQEQIKKTCPKMEIYKQT